MIAVKIFPLLIFFLLSACADQGLGFGKSPPDEFLVLTYPPLTVPPNISLRAPSNTRASSGLSTTALAERSVYGQNLESSKNMSPGEKALLKLIKADKAQNNIRQLIAADRGFAVYPRPSTSKITPQQIEDTKKKIKIIQQKEKIIPQTTEDKDISEKNSEQNIDSGDCFEVINGEIHINDEC